MIINTQRGVGRGSIKVVQQRLPTVNGDNGTWGDLLNQFLQKEHYNTGTDNAANGGHQTITIRPGTTAPGTAPLKLTSGPLLSIPEEGAIEYLNGVPYMTVVANATLTRKIMVAINGSGIATGDLIYLAANGEFAVLHAGLSNQVLVVQSGIPAWITPSSIGRSINIISTATTAGANSATDYVYYVSGITTITLPTASGNTNRYSVTNTGTNIVTVATTSAQTIDGSTTVTLPIPNMSLDFISNGTNWVIQ